MSNNEMILELEAMQKQIMHGNTFFSDVANRIKDMQELLRSAHAIADRKGDETHWERFSTSIDNLGIGSVTARTYRILPSDKESFWFKLNDRTFLQNVPISGINVRVKLSPSCSQYDLALIKNNVTDHYVTDTETIENGSELWAIPPCGFSK